MRISKRNTPLAIGCQIISNEETNLLSNRKRNINRVVNSIGKLLLQIACHKIMVSLLRYDCMSNVSKTFVLSQMAHGAAKCIVHGNGSISCQGMAVVFFLNMVIQ